MVPPFLTKCRASMKRKKWQHHCQSSRGRRKRWLTLCGMQYILSQELTTQYNQARDDISVSQCITVNTSMGGGRTHKHKNMPEQKKGKTYGSTYKLPGQLALFHAGVKTHSMHITQH